MPSYSFCKALYIEDKFVELLWELNEKIYTEHLELVLASHGKLSVNTHSFYFTIPMPLVG